MPFRASVGLTLSASFLLLCACSASSSGSRSSGAEPEGGQTGTPVETPSGGAAPTPGTTECASPASGEPTTISHPAGSPTAALTLPVKVTGTTSDSIDFQYFTFTLTDVAKLHLKLAIDFSDGSEKTGVGIEVHASTPGHDSNIALAHVHVDPSTKSDEGSSDWLYPGRYQIMFSRTTYASANTSVEALTHPYSFSVDVERPPAMTAGCTWPATATSATDVKAFPECNAWCKKLPACGAACRNDCEIPVGQCEASVRAQLTCLANAGFECVEQAGATGYSTDAICDPDPSVCPAGTIRQN